ncbi:nonsense-mediated mRNA decay NMD3 family protein [Striga hermonthica]|uniref:60S ribosomal export protein NMD3 n=1 Tax=Striga hermonthica TaxID=68872 RepID=A0A9N7RBV6_STRHE|nr:nonsense-mediated mRNA decay NMD3 family protein [Striga hermonthica]
MQIFLHIRKSGELLFRQPLADELTTIRKALADMDEDNGMFRVPHTIGSVLCCKCGIPMQPNAANMCAKCLRSEFDITEGLQKHVIINHCPDCESYLQPPRTWIKAELESRELLTFCLNRLKNLRNTVKLVNSEFVWTEPHSKRIKVKLTVQKEVLNVFLQQAYIVEYVVQDQLCESCSKVQANPDQWVAAVQLRQHVSHRRTFFYLEQLILKHDAARNAIKIKQMDHGIDFFFNKRSHGLKFVEFVGKVAPVRSRSDKQLVSHDSKSNNYNYKFTFSVEISPICREDLICLPPKVAAGLGNFGPLVICIKVSNSIALLDPFTLSQSFLDAEQYWRSSFKALLSSRQLVEYIVLDVEPVSGEVNIGGLKYVLADAQVARVSDFGKNDTIFNVRTHLGHLLNPGDYALGYDLYGANNNDIELDKYKSLVLPDVLLIKKSYEEKRQRKKGKARSWKLKSLNMEVDNSARGVRDNAEKMDTEYEQFLRDLEENPDLRFNLSLYRNKEYQPSEMASMTDGEDLPSVPLDELLADLDLSDENVADDDDDDGMRE